MAMAALGSVTQTSVQLSAQGRDQAKANGLATYAASSSPLQPANNGTQTANAAQPSLTALRLATRQVEQAVHAQASSLNFSIDQSSGKTSVTVTDSETGQVLRRIPSEEMLSLSQAINNVQGLLLSQMA